MRKVSIYLLALLVLTLTLVACQPQTVEVTRVVTQTAGDWESPSWAPDARHVVCSRTQGRRSTLMVVDTWTGKTRELFNTRYNLTMPDWSDLVR